MRRYAKPTAGRIRGVVSFGEKLDTRWYAAEANEIVPGDGMSLWDGFTVALNSVGSNVQYPETVNQLSVYFGPSNGAPEQVVIGTRSYRTSQTTSLLQTFQGTLAGKDAGKGDAGGGVYWLKPPYNFWQDILVSGAEDSVTTADKDHPPQSITKMATRFNPNHLHPPRVVAGLGT